MDKIEKKYKKDKSVQTLSQNLDAFLHEIKIRNREK